MKHFKNRSNLPKLKDNATHARAHSAYWFGSNDPRDSPNKGLISAIISAFAFAAIVSGGHAFASEDDLSHYPNGVNTIVNGILPAPGSVQFYNYSEYYEADELDGSHGQSIVPNFHAKIAVDAPRLVYTWPGQLGPFHVSSGLLTTVADIKLTAGPESGEISGFTDLIVEPFYLSYARPDHKFFAYIGPDIWLPTGSYSKTRLTNLGNNYYTIGMGLHMTYLPTKDTEFDASIVPEFNSTNRATDYKSGDSVNIDVAAHFRPFANSLPHLRIAFQGYVHKQYQDDTVNNAQYLNGNKGQEVGLGPQLEYDIGNKGGILFKYDQEFAVQNRPKGHRIWFEFSAPIK